MVLQERMHFDNLIKFYETKNWDIIKITTKLDHDGYDRYGPQSNLYYLMVIHKEKNDCNFYINFWTREYWFRDKEDDEPYEVIRKPSRFFRNIFNKSNCFENIK